MAWCVSLSELTDDNDADWAGWELGRDGEDLRCWQVGGVDLWDGRVHFWSVGLGDLGWSCSKRGLGHLLVSVVQDLEVWAFAVA